MVTVHAHAETGYTYTYQPAKYRQARVYRSERRFRLYPWLKAFLVVVLSVGLLLGYVGLRTAIIMESYAIKRLDDQLMNLKAQREKLQLEVSQLESLDRIEKVARTELGMSRPRELAYIALNPAPPEETMEQQASWWGKLVAWVQGLAGSGARAAHE